MKTIHLSYSYPEKKSIVDFKNIHTGTRLTTHDILHFYILHFQLLSKMLPNVRKMLGHNGTVKKIV